MPVSTSTHRTWRSSAHVTIWRSPLSGTKWAQKILRLWPVMTLLFRFMRSAPQMDPGSQQRSQRWNQEDDIKGLG